MAGVVRVLPQALQEQEADRQWIPRSIDEDLIEVQRRRPALRSLVGQAVIFDNTRDGVVLREDE